jgi:hypothetical protein
MSLLTKPTGGIIDPIAMANDSVKRYIIKEHKTIS